MAYMIPAAKRHGGFCLWNRKENADARNESPDVFYDDYMIHQFIELINSTEKYTGIVEFWFDAVGKTGRPLAVERDLHGRQIKDAPMPDRRPLDPSARRARRKAYCRKIRRRDILSSIFPATSAESNPFGFQSPLMMESRSAEGTVRHANAGREGAFYGKSTLKTHSARQLDKK